MATYLELLALSSNADLRSRTKVALVVAADKVRQDGENSPAPVNQAARERWAALALAQIESEAQRALYCILAQNKDLTVGQITGATDAQLQAAVDAAVDLLAVRYG